MTYFLRLKIFSVKIDPKFLIFDGEAFHQISHPLPRYKKEMPRISIAIVY